MWKSKLPPAGVAIHQGREDFVGQGGGHEQRVLPQAFEHRRANLHGKRMAFRQLQVVLGFRRLVPGGDLAVSPFSFFQRLTDASHLLG